MASVVVVGGSTETRLLLRGLLRLHRHHVVGEGETLDAVANLPTEGPDRVVVLDVDLDDPKWSTAISKLHRAYPGLRIVLLVPSRSPRLEERARGFGVTALVPRPFAVHEFIDAVVGDGGAASDPPPGRPLASDLA